MIQSLYEEKKHHESSCLFVRAVMLRHELYQLLLVN
ncbi:unnamed protein product [Arabidopsis halleri]